MRIIDKNILDSFFKTRRELFEKGVEDVTVIESILKDKINSFDSSKAISKQGSILFSIASSFLHYREVCYFSKSSVEVDLFNTTFQLLNDAAHSKAKISDGVRVTLLYSLAMSHMPFVRGSIDEVYSQLLRNNQFITYFDSVKNCLKIFTEIKSLNTVTSVSFLCENLEQEAYGVWQEYASANHLSDSIFLLFLNSDMRFLELEAFNNEHLKDIEGLADEWQSK